MGEGLAATGAAEAEGREVATVAAAAPWRKLRRLVSEDMFRSYNFAGRGREAFAEALGSADAISAASQSGSSRRGATSEVRRS
jgi:hypothetical protein